MIEENRKYIIALLITIFLVLTLAVKSNNINISGIDSNVSYAVSQIRSPLLNSVMINITKIGSSSGAVITFFLFAVFLFYKKRKDSIRIMAIAAISAAVSNELIKLAVERARPAVKLIGETGFSYPSGHSTMATIFLFSSILFIAPAIDNARARKTFLVLSSSLFILIAFSRIYLSVHWTTDVLGSIVLASLCFLFAKVISPRFS